MNDLVLQGQMFEFCLIFAIIDIMLPVNQAGRGLTDKPICVYQFHAKMPVRSAIFLTQATCIRQKCKNIAASKHETWCIEKGNGLNKYTNFLLQLSLFIITYYKVAQYPEVDFFFLFITYCANNVSIKGQP
jgi:hypothetical protein